MAWPRPNYAKIAEPGFTRVAMPRAPVVSAPLITAPAAKGGNWFSELLGKIATEKGGEFLSNAWDFGVDALFGALPKTEESSTAPNLLEGLDQRYRLSPGADQAIPESYPQQAQAQPPKEPVAMPAGRQEASGAEAIVRQAALDEGVDPDVMVAVWQQESGGSTDLGLRGQTLPGGHKYAGHYARGPFQIMSFHGDIPDDFAGQAQWAARHLKERGVAGYYGSGSDKPVTGMPNQPTGAEYVSQVQSRAAQMRNASGQVPVATRETGQQAVQYLQADSQFRPQAQQEGEVSPGFWEYASGSWQRQQKAAAQRQQQQLLEINLERSKLSLKQELDDFRDEQAYEDRLTPEELDDYRGAKYQDPQALARRAERARRAQLQAGGEPEVRLGPQGERMTWNGQRYVPAPGMPAVQQQQPAAPSGYQWTGEGALEPIPGGPASGGGGLDINQQVTAAAALRDDLDRDVRLYTTPIRHYEAVQGYKPEEMNGTQDWALLIALGRTLDPESTLQQGEMEVLQGMSSGRGGYHEAARQVLLGNTLTPEQRRDVLNELEDRARSVYGRARETYELYGERAARIGVDPMLVVPRSMPEFKARRPKVISVEELP